MWTAKDYQFMSRAIQLAKHGQYTCDPNPIVGCVITKKDCVIAEGWHELSGNSHAESMHLILAMILKALACMCPLSPVLIKG